MSWLGLDPRYADVVAGVGPSVRRAEGSFVEQLAGQVALVTGGARGQGRAHAVALAAAGATVVVCDIAAPLATVPYPLASAGDLDETVRIIADAGGRASAAIADVRDSAAVTGLTDRIAAEHGRLDILIANAGICVL